jgi:hypothetical protein
MCIYLAELGRKICSHNEGIPEKPVVRGDATTELGRRTRSTSRRRGGTTVILKGSVYGLLQYGASIPSRLLVDRYQPSFPRPLNGESFILRGGVIRPLVAINLRHVFSKNDASHQITSVVQPFELPNDADQEDRVTEIGSILLPAPAAIVKLSKSMLLPHDKLWSSLQIATEKSLWRMSLP